MLVKDNSSTEAKCSRSCDRNGGTQGGTRKNEYFKPSLTITSKMWGGWISWDVWLVEKENCTGWIIKNTSNTGRQTRVWTNYIYISFWDSPTLSHLVEMAKYDPVWLIWRKHKQRFSLSKLRNSGDFLSISLDAILQTTSDNQIYKLVTLVISLLFITPMD